MKREERSVAIAAARGEEPGLALEGLFVAGGAGDAGGAVLAPPHPLYGGSMDSPVVSELAWSCGKAGLATLRFNWRGIGASAGAPSGESDAALADYTAALRHLGETTDGPLVAGGYSFGAAAATRAWERHQRVSKLLLVAPPPALLDDALARFRGRVLLVTGEHDRIAPPDAVRQLAADREGWRAIVIPEADHFFGAGLAALSQAVADWLGG